MTAVEWKKEAIRYWEKRRLGWNLLLIIPTLFGYLLGIVIFSPAAFDRMMERFDLIIIQLGILFFGVFCANLCYTFAYAIEFLFMNSKRETVYRAKGRPILFGLGGLIGIILAFSGGSSIPAGL